MNQNTISSIQMAMMFTTQIERTREKELACTVLSCKSLVVNDLFECCTLEILISGHRNIIVSCIYRCPGSNTDIFSEHIVQ